MGGVTDEVLLARALISRVAEPSSIRVWRLVRREGPVEAAKALCAGRAGDDLFNAEAARAARADIYADLEAAQRHDIRLVVPEADEWPHFAFAALEAAGLRRLHRYEHGDTTQNDRGELIPPIALWVRGSVDLAGIGVRSVAIVGARAATEYGTWVARDLAARLATRNFIVVSGGAHGIDAAAHRGALSAPGGATVLVSAGGLDRPYPPSNAGLFEQVAESGLLISESPPGCDPKRRRFLTRNRVIAALGSGTLVVEAAARSGAMNTARHCTRLGRPLMAVPGPITSAASVGCHALIRAECDPAQLVSCVDDIVLAIGSASDVADTISDQPRRRGEDRSDRLDALDPAARQVFDGFPARGPIGPDALAVATGMSPLAVIRTLPILELSGLIEEVPGGFRVAAVARGGLTGSATRATVGP
jgi:DNA processing protein